MLFHPPINRELGPLQRDNWKRIGDIFREKGVEYVVIETAVRDREDLIKGYDIITQETEYVKDVLGL